MLKHQFDGYRFIKLFLLILQCNTQGGRLSSFFKAVQEKTLSAISNLTRVEIVKALSRRGSLSFTEIMRELGMDSKAETGKFAYHVHQLMEADLINVDPSTGNYRLTRLGRSVVDFLWSLEDHIRLRSGRMLVRTSDLTIEAFDREKIVKALVREANAPRRVAEEVAREVEDRLYKLEVKYLTAPLIREFVNAVLIEKGYEDWRHTHTRLGLPVFDVTELIKKASQRILTTPEAVQRSAGGAILEEYLLLKTLPRSVADAHLSGAIHINNAECFIMKPASIQHDLRPLLEEDFSIYPYSPTLKPPKTLKASLSLLIKLIAASQHHVSLSQSIDHFNIFLAPFAKGLSYGELREELTNFIYDLNMMLNAAGGRPQPIALNIEMEVLKDLMEAPIPAQCGGTSKEVYGDYVEESGQIFKALMEAFLNKDAAGRPFPLPLLIIKVRGDASSRGEDFEDMMLKAAALSLDSGPVAFANLVASWQGFEVNYDGCFLRLGQGFKEGWDLNTLRTGCIDNVTLNLPRIAYDSRGSDNMFLENLHKTLDSASEALMAKHRVIQERLQDNLLPLLSLNIKGHLYYRLENATHVVSYVGLNEAVKAHVGSQIHEEQEAYSFALKIVESMEDYLKDLQKKTGLRWALSSIAPEPSSSRLAELDLRKYGSDKVVHQGAKGSPYYNDLSNVAMNIPIPIERRISIEEEFHKHTLGGHIFLLHLREPVLTVEDLSSFLKLLLKSSLGLFSCVRDFTYCKLCKACYGGLRERCPRCSSSGDRIVRHSRVMSIYEPTSSWTYEASIKVFDRYRYLL